MTEDPTTPDRHRDPDATDGAEPGSGRDEPTPTGHPGRDFAPPVPPGFQTPSPQAWGGTPVPPAQGWAPPPPNAWGQSPTPGGPPPGGPAPGGPAQGWGWAPPPKPGVVPLRPLGIGDLLDGSFQAIRRNAGATLGLPVMVQLFVGVVTALVTLPLFSVVGTPDVLEGADPDFNALTGSLLTLVGGSLLATLVSVFLLVIVQGAITIPVLRAVLNRKTRFGQALRILRPSIGRLLLVALLYLAAGLAGLLVCAGIVTVVALNSSAGVAFTTAAIVLVVAVPTAVWISVRITFTAHAVVAENLGVRRALARSFTLVKSSWWRCFGILLLTGIIVGVVTSLITSPLSMAGGMIGGFMSPEDPGALVDFLVKFSFITTILTAVATGLGFAYQCAVTTLLYTDLRIRRDGFDLELLREFDAGIDAPLPGMSGGIRPGHDAGSPGVR
ncbi:glycerophosphoryl diester phosphodiesterase membrane domain-containing protein [Arthrobacter sp.]|uniref:glycerophosphoryl diester phosphodiesterase membrane domain-containing protein n=1 Tax=Arthrobacter sp. TaxID=1667 RepID=UPI003A8EE25C